MFVFLIYFIVGFGSILVGFLVRVIVITDEEGDQKGEDAAGVLLTDFTFCLAIFLSANTQTHQHREKYIHKYFSKAGRLYDCIVAYVAQAASCLLSSPFFPSLCSLNDSVTSVRRKGGRGR